MNASARTHMYTVVVFRENMENSNVLGSQQEARATETDADRQTRHWIQATNRHAGRRE